MKQYLWPAILLAASLGGLLTLVTVNQQPPMRAHALVQLSVDKPILPPEPPALPDPKAFEVFRQEQASLVKSRLVLNKALRDPKVSELEIVQSQADPVAWLEKNLVVDSPFAGRDDLMRISLSVKNPEAAMLVDAVVNAYVTDSVYLDKSAKEKRYDRVKTLLAEVERSLQEKRRILQQFQSSIGDKQKRTPATLDQEATELKKELQRLRLAQVAAKVRLEKSAAKQDGEALKEEIAVLAAQEKLVRDDLADLAKKKVEGIDLGWLINDIEPQNNLVRRLQAQAFSIQLELDAPPRITLLQVAVVAPVVADAAKRTK